MFNISIAINYGSESINIQWREYICVYARKKERIDIKFCPNLSGKVAPKLDTKCNADGYLALNFPPPL